MQLICFYSCPVSASIVLKWNGKVRKMYRLDTMEITDVVSGLTFPVIFFQ
ncbi:MAG TPA: hypothetical protein PKJ28_05535 [Bacteroidales bacterium]|nr:hypothetical protein [Bacteroidales bacterium]HPS72965.1 hypothetical protein [Bacteroidales bacterium]